MITPDLRALHELLNFALKDYAIGAETALFISYIVDLSSGE